MVILTVKPVNFFNEKFVSAILAASLGAFQHGYHTCVLNIPYMMLQIWTSDEIQKVKNKEKLLEISDVIFHLSVSFFFLGAFAGALLSMAISACFGPRNSILLNNISIFVGIGMMALAQPIHAFTMFFLGRICCGIGVGMNSVLIPMYLVEIAPTNLRGCVGAFYQVLSAFGMMVALCLSIPEALGSYDFWPYLYVIPLLPLILQMCIFPICPESPRYLFIVKGLPEKAENNLYWLRNNWNADLDMEEIYDEAIAIADMPHATFAKMFELRCFRTPLLISVFTMIGQQLTGYLFFYAFSQFIFMRYLEEYDKYYLTAILGVVTLVGACLAPFLIEICGRRNLILSGYMGVIFSMLLFAICIVITNALQTHIAVFFMYCFAFMFAISLGAIPWIYPHEIFGQNGRVKGAALAAATNWLLGFIVVQIFMPLSMVFKSFIFWILVILDILFYVLTLAFLPETRGREGAEILDIFQ